MQAAHYANLRGFVQNVLLQRLLLAVEVMEWPLTIARRATIPLLEQVLLPLSFNVYRRGTWVSAKIGWSSPRCATLAGLHLRAMHLRGSCSFMQLLLLSHGCISW